MANQTQSEQLDKVIEGLLGPADAPLSPSDAARPFDVTFAPVIEIIRDLKNLPRPDFKTRLKADLERRATMASAAGKAVQPIPEGFRSVTPYLIVPGAAGLIEFMKQSFGAEERFRAKRPGGEEIMHAEVRIGGSVVELGDANPEVPPSPIAIWLRVDDVDAAFDRATKAGATPLHQPSDQEYDSRDGSVKDAWGNNWYLFTPKPSNTIFQEVRGVTPYFHPAQSSKLIDFLREAFGAEEIYRAQSPDGVVHHAQVRIGDSIIGMGDANGPYQPMQSTLHLYVPNADAVYEQALRAGAETIRAPRDESYGDRTGGVKDPFGNRWWIATHIKDVQF